MDISTESVAQTNSATVEGGEFFLVLPVSVLINPVHVVLLYRFIQKLHQVVSGTAFTPPGQASEQPANHCQSEQTSRAP